jgi:hypothetical protein
MVPEILIGLGVWEAFWWARRNSKRKALYGEALAHARLDGVPLVVVGAPDRGTTEGPGCGDMCIDIEGCACPVQLKADITQPLPFADNSVVVFVSCVLEYVDDASVALRELQRVSGGRLYIAAVEPWTLTAYLYPGARRTLPSALRG